MNILELYLAPDRRWALARGEILQDRAYGAVLFADISGFTPLTEAVTRSMGVRRGAEELTKLLNRVYDTLIKVIETYGGSVVTFSGDAITCWFPDGCKTAVACACQVQTSMRQFDAVPLPDGKTIRLAIKVTVAAGSVRRFIVGDPNIRLLDVIAGSTVARAATAEHLAQPGEILLDEPTIQELGAAIEIAQLRTSDLTGERFGILGAQFAHAPPPPPPPPSLDEEQLKPWLDAGVYARARAEGETFLTELRPVVAMFTRFQGIDFDSDQAAGEKLNHFIVRVQQVLVRYGGVLLELTVGDKGSYFYATFGAPHTHEDDARRAVLAARELFPLCRELSYIEPLQIGISQGVMRVGGYGGSTRRTYGAQGDEANLAARLMSEAAPGTMLVSGRIQRTIANEFDLEPLPPIRLKGKNEPLLPFVVQGVRETRVQELQDAYYSLPMIGREREFGLAQEKLAEARRGAGQIIGITARAGMGKSRLTAEIIRSVRRRGEATYGGECQSFGTNISYLVWVPIWRAFFGIDSNLPLRRQLRALEGELDELAPERAAALPLLGMVLQLPIPDNDFTRALEPELRKSTLHAVLRDCLKAAAEQAQAEGQLLLFVIEDAHWIDPASRELLNDLASTLPGLPVVFLINYRPPEFAAERLVANVTAETWSNFTELVLAELTDAQGEGLIRAKLAQHAPENSAAVPDDLIARVNAQAQGNPFYIEQILDYLHDRGMNLRDPDALQEIQVPNTLHRLVLSRIDRLNEHQQRTLKAASIIGRWFSVAHLCGYLPLVGTPEQVRDDLALLQQYDFTTLEHPEPELAYLFKHIVTHQVAYESLAYATRAELHEAYASFLETHEELGRVLDLLAYHYDHSENLDKRREYLRHAGQSAAARFANVEAVDYLTRALNLTPVPELQARYELLAARERVFDVQGARDPQRSDLAAMAQIADESGAADKHFSVLLKQGWLAERTSDHAKAIQIGHQIENDLVGAALAVEERTALEMELALLWGVIFWQRGNPFDAKPHLERALELSRQTADSTAQARALSFLGNLHRELGEYSLAQTFHLEQLAVARANGDRRREWAALNNLGLIADTRGDFEAAVNSYLECLEIVRKIGDRMGEGLLLSNLAFVAMNEGNYGSALEYSGQALAIAERIGDRRSVCRIVINQGETYRLLGAFAQAQIETERGLALARDLGDQLYEGGALGNLSAIALAQNDPARAVTLANEALPILRATGNREGEAAALNTLAEAQLLNGETDAAQTTFENALQVWQTLEPLPPMLQAYAGLAEIALKRGTTQDISHAQGYAQAVQEFTEQHPTRAADPAALAASLVVYRVLERTGSSQARPVLEAAYRGLISRAEKIRDQARRQTFLENVPANRALAQVARVAGIVQPA